MQALVAVVFFFLVALDLNPTLAATKDLGQQQRLRACREGDANRAFPFCNASLPIQARVEDLVSRMSLSEKISQIVSNASGIPRLGLPAYQWWEEALHGVAASPGVEFRYPIAAATSFPQVILTAASFNATLWSRIAQAISTEARAMFNAGLSGLTFWSPNINIFRDPRWGRGQETPGEDPFLSGRFAASFVRGLQEADRDQSTKDGRLKVSSCCKHFTAYDMENSGGTDRFHFNAEVTMQDLEDTFNPPFKACVQDGRASGIMCSYNRVNGVPTCSDYNFLTDTVRNSWGFDGYIVSDCDAVALLYESINYTKTTEEAAADVLLAGLDLNCGTFLLRHTSSAIQQGRVTEASVDRAVSNVMAVRMRLGVFDENGPYDTLGSAEVCTPDHQALSLEAAEQGIVLLKNEGDVLPLHRSEENAVAVIGPNGNATDAMLGNYAGTPCGYVTPIQGFMKWVASMEFQPGCATVRCNDSSSTLLDSAVAASSRAGTVILVVGLDTNQEAEDLDRTNLLLPGRQQELVTKVASVAKRPVILVVMSGGPVDISFAKSNPNISSILWVGYPGERGGQAIANVVFGGYNPAGRLPVTWYPEDFTRVSMLDMNMRPNVSSGYPGRTYRFYTGSSVYPFGFGLSYTKFVYTAISAPMALRVSSRREQDWLVQDVSCKALDLEVAVEVSNIGSIAGDDVVMLFSSPPARAHGGSAEIVLPKKQLVAFQRIHLRAGEATTVRFSELNWCRDLSLVDHKGRRFLMPGRYEFQIGDALRPVFLFLNHVA